MLTFICYPKCTTCQKAKALLDSYHAQYETRDIKTDNPSYDELKAWLELSGLPIKKFFNTSGQLYRSLGLKDKLPSMREDECLKLLAMDGMLVKRPLLVDEFRTLVGFDSGEWMSVFTEYDRKKLDEKTAYYELTLAVEKESFVDFMRKVEEPRQNELFDALMQADERSKAGYKATLRLEKKTDWKVVEQITYRAFKDAPPTGDDDGNEALLARNLRSRAAFVQELDYVAELAGSIIGNIMYTRSKVVNDDGGEWETLTFGPISVLPKYQRQGVGGALIRKTLEVARELGYRAILIYGHESYYPRFGFKPASEYKITTADGKNFPAFMALPLNDDALDGVSGRLICDEAYTSLDKEESDKLNAKLAEPMDVDEYIAALPEHIRQDVQTVRLMIRMALPDAMEKMSWDMPTYWDGRNLIHFAAHKYHLGIYPGAEAIAYFAPRLTKLKTSKGAIQLPYKELIGKHLPLITEIATWCAKSVE